MSANAQTQELLKAAEVEMFVKIATAQGIDLNKLDDTQVTALYNRVFNKTAGDENPFPPKVEAGKDDKSDEDKKKDEEAKKDEAEKAASAEFARLQTKQAEAGWADQLGRVMAHSYVDELAKIAAEQGGQGAAAGAAGATATEPAKTASAFPVEGLSSIDKLALGKAVEIAKTAGLDPKVAEARVNAVAVLGLPEEGSKIAAASSVEQCIEIRALEYLESAGYPVTWGESK